MKENVALENGLFSITVLNTYRLFHELLILQEETFYKPFCTK